MDIDQLISDLNGELIAGTSSQGEYVNALEVALEQVEDLLEAARETMD